MERRGGCLGLVVVGGRFSCQEELNAVDKVWLVGAWSGFYVHLVVVWL